jgi:hypothetical protein
MMNKLDPPVTPRSDSSIVSHLFAYRVDLVHLPCANCGSTERKLGVGKGPHSASLRCGECDRFIKWIAKAQLAKIQNQGGQK